MQRANLEAVANLRISLSKNLEPLGISITRDSLCKQFSPQTAVGYSQEILDVRLGSLGEIDDDPLLAFKKFGPMVSN